MSKVLLTSVGQREKSVLSGLRCLAAILPPNPGGSSLLFSERVGFEFSNCPNHWLKGKMSHERRKRGISSFPTRHNPEEFFPHLPRLLRAGRGGRGGRSQFGELFLPPRVLSA